MRADCVLREHLRMPPHVAPVVVSRIKVMARLDIAERRVPQDGRIGLTLAGKVVDVRVSTLPSRAGERVVRSEEHTSELQSLMRISYAVFCLKKKNNQQSR